MDRLLFLIGLMIFAGAFFITGLVIFTLMYESIDFNEYDELNIIFNFSLLLIGIGMMFFLGSTFLQGSFEKKESQTNQEVIRN